MLKHALYGAAFSPPHFKGRSSRQQTAHISTKSTVKIKTLVIALLTQVTQTFLQQWEPCPLVLPVRDGSVRFPQSLRKTYYITFQKNEINIIPSPFGIYCFIIYRTKQYKTAKLLCLLYSLGCCHGCCTNRTVQDVHAHLPPPNTADAQRGSHGPFGIADKKNVKFGGQIFFFPFPFLCGTCPSAERSMLARKGVGFSPLFFQSPL